MLAVTVCAPVKPFASIRVPETVNEPEAELAVAFGRGISSLLDAVLRSTAETPANRPPVAEIRIGSALGRSRPPLHGNTGFTPVVLEGLIPPVVQLNGGPLIALREENPELPAGIEVIGAGNVNCSVAVDKSEMARSEPMTMMPSPLPLTLANALGFVLMSPVLVSGMIEIWIWANKLGAIVKSARMVTSPTNRDFKVIYSPFEVVQQKLKCDKPTSSLLLAGFRIHKVLTALTKPENSVEMFGAHVTLRSYLTTSSSIEFPVKTF